MKCELYSRAGNCIQVCNSVDSIFNGATDSSLLPLAYSLAVNFGPETTALFDG